MSKYIFPNIPYDVELLIFRYLHEIKMNEVLSELKEENDLFKKLISYIHNTYPIEFMKRVKKDVLSSSKRSLFYKNKILGFMR